MHDASSGLPMTVALIGLSAAIACATPNDPALTSTDTSTSEGTTNASSSESDADLPDTDDGANFIGEEGEEPSVPPSEIACETFANAPHLPIVAAASPADAATAAFVPDPAVVYDVTLPEDAPGYVQLQIAGWGTVQAFYTTAEIDYEVSATDGSQQPYPRELNPACPESGITEQRIGFPHWDPALVEFAAEGPRLVPLVVIEE